MTIIVTAELVKHLVALGNGEIESMKPEYGLCFELEEKGLIRSRFDLVIYFKQWPKYSGSETYPVPHESMRACVAFTDYDSMWTNDQYGNDRRELCLFLADCFKARLQS